MAETRIKISSILENQLPDFVREEFPLVVEFLKQYYIALEGQGSTLDILQNIDQYIKVDSLTNLTTSTTLSSDVSFVDDEIFVDSTYGFPSTYGLILIDNEIITYTGKTNTSFTGCIRGFSGVTSFDNPNNPDQLVFSESEISDHSSGSQVENLSVLFLQEFFKKVKTQITPGFEEREFYSGINESLFIKQSKDFYSSKGTEQSFEILFRVLFGQDVEVIRPQDYLIKPSDADYRINNDLVVESISGDLEQIVNRTIYQDQTDFLNSARGTVTKVERIQRGEKEYFILSLDYGYDRDIDVDGTIFGSFSIHPSTRIITPITDITSTTIDVDSTIGFPSSGELVVDLENGSTIIITYTDKTNNQFLNCSGISDQIPSESEIRLNAYAYANIDGNLITFRVTGVLSDIYHDKPIPGFSINDPVTITSLGKYIKDVKYNNWFFNIQVEYNVRSIDLLDSSDGQTYAINVYDDHSFVIGDTVLIKRNGGSDITAFVIGYRNEKSFTVRSESLLPTNDNLKVVKKLSKTNFSEYPELNIYTSNVQNVYCDKDGLNLYVTSPSLPTYLDTILSVDDGSITFSGTFSGTDINIGNHSFYTGDAVYYRSGGSDNNLGISDGTYFVKRVSETIIKIARSRTNLSNGNYVSVNGSVTDNQFSYQKFVDSDGTLLKIEPQKLVREISDTVSPSSDTTTIPGPTGILVNGVEVLNYKSKDNVYYGPITEINPTAAGSGYDILNPPLLQITDSIGYGATAHCSVLGNLERIDILDSGFDYVSDPVIRITGGNGSDAKAIANLVSFEHSVRFNATSGVSTSNNTIQFIDYHKFRDYEKVIYNSEGQSVIGGLVSESIYYVSVQDSYTIKLHKNLDDSILGINEISLTSLSTGVHLFKSSSLKKKIGSITITNSGVGYQSKKTTTSVAGINTYSNSINIKNHGYLNGEIIAYDCTESPIIGLSTSLTYFVTKLDNDNFKLSLVGVGTQEKDFYYKTRQYIDLQNQGSGIHIFNYEQPSVTIDGIIGVSTLSGQDFNAQIQPIFRGEIQSVHVENGGQNYGSSEILNLNRQPLFTPINGSGAQIAPVIENNKIVDVVVLSSGSNYNSIPNLILDSSTGSGAVLTPVIQNGQLTSVTVINGGIGYTQSNTSIRVESAGSGAGFEAKINPWNINLVERFVESGRITDDDGFVSSSIGKFGLQYLHAYAPRNLRKSVLGSGFKNGAVSYKPDLNILNGREIDSTYHSPIIGWAYDGNPIYGPYGYSSITGGSVRSMVSGYELRSLPGRPSTSLFPLGLFVEDYEFVGGGDLDEHNGRYCVTPEYPNGVYAYFMTINNGSVDSVGVFENYKKPVFPYVIGDSYKSQPNEFNFLQSSNQTQIDINEELWFRNTYPYNLSSPNSQYNYILQPNKIVKQNSNSIYQSSIVRSVVEGRISSIGISSGGNNYQVNDYIEFEVNELDAKKPAAKVSSVSGKNVISVSAATSSFTGVEFYPQGESDKYVAFTTSPHNFNNLDLVNVSTTYEYQQESSIIVRTNSLSLSSGIGSDGDTGEVAYLEVYGILSPNLIRENDIYQIGEEQVKILNVDSDSSRIRVLRSQNGTSGVSTYPAGTILSELSRKFVLNFQSENDYNQRINKEIYFNPAETLGIGSVSGVGIGTTIFFANPGVGITQIFIPTKTLYLKNHELSTGDQLIYNSNGGTQVSVSTDGSSSFQLSNNSILYAIKLSSDLIGISTVKVGLGSTGSIVGVGSTVASKNTLYLTNVGTGDTHSFVTDYSNILVGEVFKNEVTVSTATTHGLQTGDYVDINVISGLSTTIVVEYDDYNRRMIINPRSFVSGDVNIIDNSITILNHGLKTGQKVIHTSTSPSGGLIDEKIYYVVVVDSNTIKLSNSKYFSTRSERDLVGITSASSGRILPINPKIEFTYSDSIIFDLSSSTLSFANNSVLYSAFDLNFYTDSNFNNKFFFSDSNNVEIVKSGIVGVDTTASLTFRIVESTPKNIFYRLDPTNLDIIPDVKLEVYEDEEVDFNNQIEIVESGYNGYYSIVGLGTTTFKYNTQKLPQNSFYNENNAIISYSTNSLSAFGPINQIDITSFGKNLSSVPGISSIYTEYGKNAILIPNTEDIGSVIKTEIVDIGFDYSSDLSLRPTASLPLILEIETQSSFDTIGVSSVGRGYYISPDLIVLDGLSQDLITDVQLKYEIGNSFVEIVKNTKGLNNLNPIIIPVNNVNGVDIDSIAYNDSTKDVIVTLGSSFSNAADFPFEIGDRVLIENVSVGVGSTGKGYNSENYGYSLFTITGTDPNIGGIGATVSYSLSEKIADGEVPGTFDPINSAGRIIPEKDFPIFDITLKKNEFFKDEIVTSNTGYGRVSDWDNTNEILKVSTRNNGFLVGEIVFGNSSATTGKIQKVLEDNFIYTVSSSSVTNKGWQTETGFLNNKFQRIHDSDYYQYFSYALRSQVSLEKWDDAVGSLNHTVGFKRFSDLIIESSPTISGISTDQNDGDFTGIADLSRFIDLNCVNDFDLAFENNITIDNKIKSDEIIFNSRVLQDYIESVGNRVLIMDDISDKFSSNPRPTRFSVVDRFSLDSRSLKYITFVEDSRFINQRQILLVTLIHDGTNGYLNQYGRSETVYDMGSFDFSISGTEGQLLFYPTRSLINDFNIELISYNIENTIASIGSTNLGDSIFVGSSTTSIPASTSSATTVVGIASTYRSSKVLVQIGATDGSYFEMDELTIIHDGSDIIVQEYGQLNTANLDSYSTSGFGTYYAYYSGSDINIDITPDSTTAVQYDINTIRISIASTESTGIGTITLNNSSLKSSHTSIAATTSPGITTISSYSSAYEAAYYVVSVEDTTNGDYQVSEVIVVSNSDVYISEFGIIRTNSSLGSIGATVNGLGEIDLQFTPIANSDIEVKVFQNSIGLTSMDVEDDIIDFNNAFIKTGYGYYEGAEVDVVRSFNLTHKQKPIFERYFDGSSSTIVNITEDTIRIPEHFFVTGEEVRYTHSGAGSTSAIGIASTSVPGIGVTDKLPSTLYIVKENELNVKVAVSASDALSSTPITLDLTSVGIGTSHRFVSTNQNSKVLVSIDNVIQSPLVSTAITTLLADPIAITDTVITFSGITSFFGGDLIKINNEIMRINSVGFGTTNGIFVQRAWAGTGFATHADASLVTKINGNYNINDNVITFITAPYGPTPVSSITNPPDSRDWVGIETHSTFSGRSFIRSGVENSSEDQYDSNYIFNDISSGFDGLNNTFRLLSDGNNVTGISTGNSIILINDVFQGPERSGISVNIIGDYDLSENSGITSITFTGNISSTSYDVNTSSIPRGGMIVSVGSSEGFGYQPLVSAGGTAIVSGLGTISSISIGNSGSGYRAGIQTVVNVGVATSSTGIPNIEFIGTAAISGGHIVSIAITNPGTGYTSTNPPIVIIDDPLSYSDIPLVYSSSSVGFGTAAVANIVVGQGSSVISFEITNSGYGYGQGDVLTFDIGGISGIPTDPTAAFREFQITVDKTISDKFSGWVIGDLQVIDPIDDLVDGSRVKFPIRIDGQQTTIRSRRGSNIEVVANLLVFVNDILQVPNQSYTFEGGSIITFSEPLKVGDTTKILFYRGTGSIDTVDVDVLETIKIGDTLRLNSDDQFLKEDPRLVLNIQSTDVVDTNTYSGPGITPDANLLRPVIWCRQTEDKIINGQQVGKDREIYEPLIYPTTNIIQNVGISSSEIFVESVKTFFDSFNENSTSQNQIILVSQDSLIGAAATAIVSTGGTISSIVISDGGVGYSTSPSVTISNPVGLGTTLRASATSTISIGGTVSSITISNPGSGYTTTNPPQVLIESPAINYEIIEESVYEGDFGFISGIQTTSVGVASTGLVFDLAIPLDSFLRDSQINPVGVASTGISGIQTGYYFVVYNSNVGNGVTSLYQNGSVLGIGSTFIDNVYEVASVSVGQTDVAGIGFTYVAKVTVSVSDYNGLSGLGYSDFYGEYSWGRISSLSRTSPKTFNYYNEGISGITTSAIVKRINPLKFINYLT